MPKRARSTCRFVETDAVVSGSDSGDGLEEGELVETEEDRLFLDDTNEAADLEERAIRAIKISKRERRIRKDDLRLIRENMGHETTPPKRVGRSRVHKPRVYQDEDEDGACSSDEDFVVSDECSSDEEAGKVAERLVKSFAKGQGSARGVLSALQQSPIFVFRLNSHMNSEVNSEVQLLIFVSPAQRSQDSPPPTPIKRPRPSLDSPPRKRVRRIWASC